MKPTPASAAATLLALASLLCVALILLAQRPKAPPVGPQVAHASGPTSTDGLDRARAPESTRDDGAVASFPAPAHVAAGTAPTARPFDQVFGDICAHLTARALGASSTAETDAALGPLYGELAGRKGLVNDYLRVCDAQSAPWTETEDLARAMAVSIGLDLAFQVMRDNPETLAAELSSDIAACLDRALFHEEYCALVTRPLLAGRFAGPEHADQIVSMLGSLTDDFEYAREPLRDILAQIWSASPDQSGVLTQAFGHDPTLSQAALVSLLSNEEYRATAVALAVERGDVKVAEAMVLSAARTLDFNASVALAKEMRRTFPYGNFLGAYSALAAQDRGALMREYRGARSEPSLARHRCDATTALCYPLRGDALAFAQDVFSADPDPEVRGTALLALGSYQSPGEFQASVTRALEDPLMTTAAHRHFIASAIENYGTRNYGAEGHAILDARIAAFLQSIRDRLAELERTDPGE